MSRDWQRDWPAPAKLNLFLHVVGRRADGLHLLQTVFRFLDHGDTLHFSPRTDGRIVPATPLPGVPAEQDLSVRAARLLQQHAGIRQGVDIHLEKRLPMGGGLGGGSADAATVLLALNHLWQAGLDSAQLQALGLGLGADVPIFIHGQAAFAEGVGEQFSPVSLPPAWYLVLVPPIGVATAEIFQAADLRRDTPRIAAADWRPGMGGNDLQPVACRLYPVIAEYLAWLRQFGPARMSGSGACVFAEFGTAASARQAHAALPVGMQGFVARGLERNPALDALADAARREQGQDC
ncbi:4-diphosphocytidyl-2-C-methylerythritol kinase [Sterolibacterium denitrificans]|uniref:4-diphosphocytidyl-2-C-methyl-D-erythritol kinase n=1 Tax=Sterolibacterium denitrificans TaxID=157592 RepID=A0A7Z7HP37_9PROT|nr:4-(cytidine 5'-diphospho)-2-C-methyl-D-erythritol kinase [Sterolibacterium denitrificans]SMB21873.1 4-diphosphocytidyl-2-C-methylerythritol kinase [Sterolibacterium denitrificans]